MILELISLLKLRKPVPSSRQIIQRFFTVLFIFLQICSLHSIPRPSRPVAIRAFGGKTSSHGTHDLRRRCICGRDGPSKAVGDWCVESRTFIGEVEGTHWRRLSWALTSMFLEIFRRHFKPVRARNKVFKS